MDQRAKYLLIGSGVPMATMLLTGILRQGVADYMVRLALDRKIPPHPIGAERRLTASFTDMAALKQMQQASKRLSSRHHETVRIRSKDGTRLVGHWMCVEHPRRVVIAMHGWRSAWDRDFGMVADFFYRNDCSVLYIEQRAHGGSGGQYMGFGLTERYDCLDWVHWVNRKTEGKLPIYLCGVSMGASTVMMAAGLPLPENVRGILADCGFTSPEAIWRHVAGNLHLSYEFCSGPAGRLAKKRLQMDMDAESCPHALSKSKTPVLFIHGTDDRFVPIEMTYENYKTCVAPKRLFVVPGAQHGMSYVVDPKGYEAAVKAFWSDFDTGISQ